MIQYIPGFDSKWLEFDRLSSEEDSIWFDSDVNGSVVSPLWIVDVESRKQMQVKYSSFVDWISTLELILDYHVELPVFSSVEWFPSSVEFVVESGGNISISLSSDL